MANSRCVKGMKMLGLNIGSLLSIYSFQIEDFRIRFSKICRLLNATASFLQLSRVQHLNQTFHIQTPTHTHVCVLSLLRNESLCTTNIKNESIFVGHHLFLYAPLNRYVKCVCVPTLTMFRYLEPSQAEPKHTHTNT